MKLKTRLGMAAAFVALLASPLWGAGNYEDYPIVGSPSFCTAVIGSGPTQSGITGQGAGTPTGQAPGTYCAQTVPAGPAELTGAELLPADTGLPNGASPQTVTVPSALLGPLNTKVNRLIGGDFGTNLWQRGTTPLSGSSPTAAVMAADRWWAISASNAVTITKQTPATTAADYLGNVGLYSWMRVARPSGTPSGATCVGQTLDKQAAAPLIGNNAVFSFWAYAPTTFSAANQQIVVSIAYFTAADASATQATIQYAGGNSSTFALSSEGAGGGIAGYQAATAGVSLGATATGVVASGAATIPLTQTPTRYAVWAPIPVTNAAGTYVTAVGVSICATPVLTTTVSTDYFEFEGAQLQAMPGASASNPSSNLPNGVIAPTGFERRAAQTEAALQYYYSRVEIESVASVFSHAVCGVSTTSIANCMYQFPTPMRLAPAMQYTAGFQTCTTGACSAQTACTALSTSATLSFAVSPQQVVIDCASSAAFGGVGTVAFLVDKGSAGGAGVISASAEP